MSAGDVAVLVGELLTAWLLGFGVGLYWAKFKQAVNFAVDN